MLNIKMLQLIRIEKNRVTEENALTIILAELLTLMCSSRATIYASQDRNIFLLMMLANY